MYLLLLLQCTIRESTRQSLGRSKRPNGISPLSLSPLTPFQLQLRGVSFSGMEFVAIQQWDPSDPTGSGGLNMHPMLEWGINVLRIPLNEGIFLSLLLSFFFLISSISIVVGIRMRGDRWNYAQSRSRQQLQIDPGIACEQRHFFGPLCHP
jgi:hypothetical protein